MATGTLQPRIPVVNNVVSDEQLDGPRNVGLVRMNQYLSFPLWASKRPSYFVFMQGKPVSVAKVHRLLTDKHSVSEGIILKVGYLSVVDINMGVQCYSLRVFFKQIAMFFAWNNLFTHHILFCRVGWQIDTSVQFTGWRSTFVTDLYPSGEVHSVISKPRRTDWMWWNRGRHLSYKTVHHSGGSAWWIGSRLVVVIVQVVLVFSNTVTVGRRFGNRHCGLVLLRVNAWGEWYRLRHMVVNVSGCRSDWSVLVKEQNSHLRIGTTWTITTTKLRWQMTLIASEPCCTLFRTGRL